MLLVLYSDTQEKPSIHFFVYLLFIFHELNRSRVYLVHINVYFILLNLYFLERTSNNSGNGTAKQSRAINIFFPKSSVLFVNYKLHS